MRRIRFLLGAALLASTASCSYLRDRALDLIDVIDIHHAAATEESHGIGLGLKVRVTDFIGTGLGAAPRYHGCEWYGRRSFSPPFYDFLNVGLFGFDWRYDPKPTEANLLFLRAPMFADTAPPAISRFRVGGTVIVPKVRGGLYLNAGEIVDFLLGLFTFDPAGDDGLVPGAPLEATSESHPVGRNTPEPDRSPPPVAS